MTFGLSFVLHRRTVLSISLCVSMFARTHETFWHLVTLPFHRVALWKEIFHMGLSQDVSLARLILGPL